MGQVYCLHCMQAFSDTESVCPHCGATAAPESLLHHLKPGSVLREKYMIGKVIGEGGFGITYIGRDLMLDMRIAVKEYFLKGFSNRNNNFSNEITVSQVGKKNDYTTDMNRFLSEARTLAKFSTEPGVVCVRDFFQENGTAYIVMEYLDGITLRDYLAQYGPMQITTLLPLMDPILRALSGIHRQDLIHRDISPDNIMLLKNGQLKLLDFGAAREVDNEKSISVVLKPGYAPEEQYRTKGRQGSWTDVYAMSATIYKCITGVTPDESLQRVFEDELKPPSQLGADISPEIETAIMQGMSIKISERVQTMDDLRYAFGLSASQESNNLIIQSYPTGVSVGMQSDEVVSRQVSVSGQQIQVNSQQISCGKAPAQQVAGEKAEKKKVGIVLGCIGILFVLLVGLLLFMAGGKKDETLLEDSLPTTRKVTGDCAAWLKNEGISGYVSDVTIEGQDVNEKFKVATLTCKIEVTDNNETEIFNMELLYFYEDGEWVLSGIETLK